jgi:hypothetical protein
VYVFGRKEVFRQNRSVRPTRICNKEHNREVVKSTRATDIKETACAIEHGIFAFGDIFPVGW